MVKLKDIFNKLFKVIVKLKLIFCVIVAILLGIIFKEKAVMFKPIGTIFINLILVVVVPLIFFSITSSVSKMKNSKKIRRILLVAFTVFILSLFITGIFTVCCIKLYSPYDGISLVMDDAVVEEVDIVSKVVSMVSVGDFYQLLTKSNILSLVIFSVILGISIIKMSDNEKVITFFDNGNKVVNKYLELIIKILPIGIIAYLAALIGEYGGMFASQYLKFIVMYLILGVLNILIFHTIYLFLAGGKKTVLKYYKNLINLIVTAVSTQSSVVTMPSNRKVIDELSVSKEVNDVVLPIATLINMQGNVIQNVMKIFLLSGLFSMHIDNFYGYFLAIVIAIFVGMITAGIPGGGVISNTVMVSMLQLPPTALPILITIEWLLDAPATAFNILSDTSVIPLIDKIVRRKNDFNRTKKVK